MIWGGKKIQLPVFFLKIASSTIPIKAVFSAIQEAWSVGLWVES